MNTRRIISFILWTAVLIIGVVASVLAISGSPAKTLLAVDSIVVGIAGLVTMTTK